MTTTIIMFYFSLLGSVFIFFTNTQICWGRSLIPCGFCWTQISFVRIWWDCVCKWYIPAVNSANSVKCVVAMKFVWLTGWSRAQLDKGFTAVDFASSWGELQFGNMAIKFCNTAIEFCGFCTPNFTTQSTGGLKCCHKHLFYVFLE